MDKEKAIKEFRNYVKTYIPCCVTDDWFRELIQCVLVVLEEQQETIEEQKERIYILEERIAIMGGCE